ncbi:hypothetical protein CR513_11765, partial [Mucuna pruriens]
MNNVFCMNIFHPCLFTKVKKKKKEKVPQRRGKSIGRLDYVKPTYEELFYMRIIYEDIRTVNNVVHETCREACFKLGLLKYNGEYVEAIKEDHDSMSNNCKPKHYLILKKILKRNKRSYNIDILTYDFEGLFSSLKDEQRQVFNTIIEVIDGNKGGVFFLNGYGGTSKTFVWRTLTSTIHSIRDLVLILWRTLTSTIHSQGNIILTVVFKIALILLPSSRITHSRFGIPIDVNQHSTCKINLNEVFGGKVFVFGDDNQLRELANWILEIRNGESKRPNDSEEDIEIPNDLLFDKHTDPISPIVKSTYHVMKINDYMLSLIPSDGKVYYYANSIYPTKRQHCVPNHLNQYEFLNSLTSLGLPNHELKLKVGVPIMLLKNIDQS